MAEKVQPKKKQVDKILTTIFFLYVSNNLKKTTITKEKRQVDKFEYVSNELFKQSLNLNKPNIRLKISRLNINFERLNFSCSVSLAKEPVKIIPQKGA